ncbi:MAG: hypothetical protein KZQ91_19375 [Candidatus Thiodiazotropha sp. (ex Lucinoma borealis)]|nr:hypothetical protein [Candidatus Thiodiazotropha sp. (ex Lucinoma borealis)]
MSTQAELGLTAISGSSLGFLSTGEISQKQTLLEDGVKAAFEHYCISIEILIVLNYIE